MATVTSDLKVRKYLRQSVTKAAKKLMDAVQNQEVTHVVNSLLRALEDRSERLIAMDEKLQEYVMSLGEEEMGQEFEEIEAYRDKVSACKALFDTCMPKDGSVADSGSYTKRLFKLPELQLSQFDGEVKNWLPFWNQFKKIDEDLSIDNGDKFLYLAQCMLKHSKADELVSSYPCSGDNYKLALNDLRQRFAREELLIDVYIRELLTLVLNSKNCQELSSLYNKIETQLRALETLGLTKDKYAAMLFPLVESTLPSEILKLWERQRSNKSLSINNTSEDNTLNQLMTFLKIEVESEEKVKAARNFKTDGKLTKESSPSVPTASSLISTSKNYLEKKISCIFCKKETHSSPDCFIAQEMTIDKRIDILKQNGCCLNCLKKGHLAQKCRAKLKCIICKQKHYPIVCNDRLIDLKTRNDKQDRSESQVKNKVVNHLKVVPSNILLQTLLIKVNGPYGSITVRALCDTGSQQSYISKDCATRLKLEKVTSEKITHSLFGGLESNIITHTVFKAELESLIEDFKLETNLLDQKTICNYIPRLNEKDANLLRSKGIELSDFGNDIPDIHILIGADYLGSIISGNTINLDNGLTATQTHFGPNLIELIPAILNRFRAGKFGVISDIRKAFLQISVAPKDRKFLRFLWWENCEQQKVVVYQHCRVVFGLTPSPFLLLATLNHLLENVSLENRAIADKLKNSFYSDNCITSVDDVYTLKNFIRESSQIMSDSKFDLRGWVHTITDSEHNLTENQKLTPVLGLLWNFCTDELLCDLDGIGYKTPLTKRKLLSVAQKIFDPIGFSAPATLVPKLLLQETWKMKLTWDTELPQDILFKFLDWCKSLKYLAMIKVPRYLGGLINEQTTTLHMFADASNKAYGACVFTRIVTNNEVCVRLVQARGRVAPLRTDPVTKIKTEMTIPKLELLASVIGTRLLKTVIESMKLTDVPKYMWSDSKIVLCWIKKVDDWNTFVRNRVKEIQSQSQPENWYYVPTDLNPADIISRGCNGQILLNSKWWEGPSFLYRPMNEWPSQIQIDNELTEELNSSRVKTIKNLVNKTAEVEEDTRLFTYFSKYSSILRMIGWMKRFIYNSLSKVQNKEILRGPLSGEEINRAEIILFKIVQKDFIVPQDLPKNLYVYEDKDGLKRIKTKMTPNNEEDFYRCPILVPEKHPITRKLIEEKHRRYNHIGVQTLITVLREKFWILKCRKVVRSTVKRCVVCQRYKIKAAQTVFATLPDDRVRMVAVFEVTGVDLAGPLYLRNQEKVWVVLFTCAVYRAIHLELVTDISTQTFLLALRRFIARRGRVVKIYSDNGTNFTGSSNLFQTIDWAKIQEFSSVQSISWCFNPPTASWWGGFWERLVGLMKTLLRKSLGRASLSFQELFTVICECEAMLNARPLTYVSEDSEDLVALTPSMFLQDQTEFTVPDLEQLDSANLCNRARYLQETKKQLRERFQKEYLSMLVQGGNNTGSNLKVGELVLIGSDDKKRIDWSMGRILQLMPGRDGTERVARVKVHSGEMIRPLQRLFPLEIHGAMGEPLRARQESQKQMHTQVSEEPPSPPPPTVKVTTKSGREVKCPEKLNI